MDAVCGLDLFSGRPNPEWKIDSTAENKILSVLEGLQQSAPSDLKSSPILGYRGAFMKFGNKELFVSKGKAALYENREVTVSCLDEDRKLEKAIVSTAPDSMDLPWDIINAGLK